MDEDIARTLDKFSKHNFQKKYKIVLDNKADIKKITKKDLENYMNYLKIRFPTILQLSNVNKSQKEYMNSILRKTKANIIDIINFHIEMKNVKSSYDVQIKGTPVPELVNVYVKKTVNKIIK